MQTWKRFLAALLALTMVTSYIPAPAYAEEIVEEVIEEAIFEEVVEEIEEEAVFEEMIEEPDVEEVVEEEIVEEIDIVVTDTVQGAQVVKGDYGELINPNAWGYCGSSVTNVTWGVYPGGTLVISGEGAMDDFGLYEEAGWWNQYPISHVIVEEGVTSIGNWAFKSEYSWHTPLLETVELASSVTSIGIGAFENCVELSAINLDYVKYISTSAFEGCTALTEVALTSLTELDSEAFKGCTGLTDLTLPGTVGRTSYAVGNESFMNCTGLTSVTVQEGVKWLGERIFDGCTKLQSISLPASLLDIGRNAFDGCTRLKEVHIADLQSWCKMNLSGYFSNNSNELANPLYYGADLYVGDQLLDNLVIPEGTDVQNSMNNFVGCGSIRSVTFPAMEGKYINWIIRNCSGIQHIYFQGSAPQGFTSDAFTGITATAYYPATDESWTSDKFGNYGGTITWVAVNEHEHAFDETSHLCECGLYGGKCGSDLNWVLDEKGTLTIFGTGEMFFWSLPPWRSYKDLIKKVIVESGVTCIDSFAFDRYTYLEAVELPESLTWIREQSFAECTSLTEITLPEKLETIGSRAFRGCTSLNSIVIPDGVRSIGSYAFSGCTNLTEVKLPKSLVSISSYTFSLCHNLASIEIPDGVNSIGEEAFDNCMTLKNVIIPEGTQVIGKGAFATCYSLESVIISESVTSIKDGAFECCYSLDEITFLGDAPEIQDQAFLYMGTIDAIYYPADAEGWETVINKNYGATEINWVPVYPTSGTCGENLTWSFDEDTGVLTISGSGAMTDFEDGGAPWEGYHDSISQIVVDEGVTTIGAYSFEGYTKLESVSLPQSLTSIGICAFEDCYVLESLSLPQNLTTLGNSAFGNCYALEELTIPAGITTVGDAAFAYCVSLTKVTVEEGVKSLGAFAFHNCTSLTEVNLPESLLFLGDAMFTGCRNLEEITIPAGVRSVAMEVFKNCESLKTITFLGNAPVFTDGCFTGCNLTAYYPGNDESWTEDVRQNYGGTITWVPLEKIVAEGQCGADVYWKLNEEGTLTIYGSGDMRYESVPWANYRNQIKMLVVESGVENLAYNAFADCLWLESVVLPEGLTRIESQVFDRCSGLKSVSLPSTLTEIGFGAFRECSALTTITLPAGLTMLGGCAFESCTNLTGTLEIPSGIKTIDQCTFYECKKLEQIVLPEGLQSIGTSVFVNCTNLRSINIPSGVAEIREFTFQGCSSLESLVLPDDLLQIGMCAFNGCEKLESINIPATVRSIDAYAFQNCTALSGTIEIPSGITEIKEQTFWNCASVESVIIPDSVTTIGNTAFSGCTSLKSITIPSSVTSIGSGVFSGCTALERVDMLGSMTTIEHSLFLGCSSLTSVNLPAGLTRIGDDVFEGCEKLESITIPSGVTEIGAHAFSWCTGLTGITIPSGVKKIEDGTFNSCKSLEKLVIPAGVTSIGYYAFSHCTGLQEITFQGEAPSFDECAFVGTNTTAYYPGDDATWTENVRQNYGGGITWKTTENLIGSGTCGENAYWKLDDQGTLTIYGTGATRDIGMDDIILGHWMDHRDKIQKVVVEDGITALGANSFYGQYRYNNITEVVIAGTVETIGENAFRYCNSLERVTLYDGIKAIGNFAFSGSNAITSLELPGSITTIGGGAFQFCDKLERLTLHDGIREIGNAAFSYCTALTTLELPDSITTIGDEAFYWCSKLAGTLNLSDSITTIGQKAFAGCTGVKEILFEGSAPTIGQNAFTAITAKAYYPAGDASWTEEVRGDYGGTITWVPVEKIIASGMCGDYVHWNLGELGTMTIYGTGSMWDYSSDDVPWISHRTKIKNVVVESGVTSVSDWAFAECVLLKTVSLPEGLTRINNNAFYGCISLTTINLPDSLTSIGAAAFDGCKNLTGITLPENLTILESCAFSYCTSLTGSLTIPSGVTVIGSGTFQHCYGLTEIILPDGLTSMDIQAFAYCTGLTSITIPEGVAVLEDTVFVGCSGLTEVNLPENLQVIMGGAFSNCNSLPSIRIPADVSIIGDGAFFSCEALDEITFLGSAPDFGEDVFAYVTATAYYPGNDATWTEEVRQGYGGTITWKALYDHENGCGENLTWAFDESTGTLTITGTGAMTDFTGSREVPWSHLVDEIQIIDVGEGVTTVGSYAFYGCTKIQETRLPEGLVAIGDSSFQYFSYNGGMQMTIPSTVEAIGASALPGFNVIFLGSAPSALDGIVMSGGTVWYDGDDTTWEEETVRSHFSNVTWMPLLNRSGVCGDDLTWTLTKDGLLTVTGTGNMYETPNWSAYMDQIKKVVISEGVTYIGARAFQDAKNLTEAEIAGTVNTIGEYAFQGCKKLSSVTMEHGVRSVDACAFNQCDALETIVLPDSVTYIGYYAFAWNENLKEITMPMAISSIGTGAFAGASALKSLAFQGGAPSFAATVFDDDVTLTIYYPADDVSWTPYVGSNYDGNITWVAQKGDYIAQGMCGPEAYWKLDHESKLTVYGSGAMSDWSYYDSTGWINSYKTQITTLVVEDGITVLGQNRFSGLTNLKNVELADSITTIVGGTFTNCGFETLELPENLKDIGNYAFQNCAELTQIVLPDSLEYLGSYAFLNCGKLTDVTFGKNLKTIGGKAFSGCALLENVVWGSEILETIGDEAFRDCTKLTGDLIFPATLVSIGEYAFYGCAGLTGKVEIPSGTVGNIAFADLGITELVLGDNVTQIGNSAFANCTALTGTLTIPNSVTEIGNEAFICCTGYSGLQLGNSLRKIGRSTFSGCEKIRVKLTLPETLEEIGNYAFSDCKMIYGLTLNSGLKQLGASAFSGCSGIRGELVIPAGVTEIQDFAFYGCSGLTKLTMHDDIRIIRDYAFDGCSNLSGELKLPENLESIGLQAFYGCTKLNGDLIIPSGVKTINDNAFGETGVTSLQFGSDGNSSLETIGSWAFYDTALTGSLQIPDSVKTIGNYAFQGCSGLTELKLGSGVETIEDGAFVGCGNLTGTLVVPDSIVTIGAEAFGWTGFSKAILGKDLWEIGTTAATDPQSNAFVGCGNLEQIIFTGVEFYPFINSGFEQVTGLKTILVPEDARTGYEIEIGERMPVGASIVGYRAMIGYDCYENLTAALNSASSEDVITMMSDDLTPTFVNQEVTIDKNGFAINAHPGKSYDEKPGETEGTVTFFAVSAQLNDAQKYITLQEAVNAAKTGDTITLLAGNQTAHVENKELTIVKGEFTATITAGEGYKVELTDTGYVVKKGANAPEFEYSMQASLNLESEVSMNVGFKFTNQSTMDDAERADVMGRVGLLIWDAGTVNEENATYENHSRVVFDIENVSYNSEKDRFEIRTEGIAAKRLGDSIDFRAFYRCEDGTYVYSRLIKNYSPKKYCYNRMGSGDQNEVNLMVAILNYGAAAQIYFGHHTDALMNADLTEEQKQIKWDGSLVRSDWNVPDEKAGKFVRSPEIISRGANLSLEGAIDNTFYAKADGSVNVAKVELLYWKEADYHNISVLTEENVSGVIAMQYVEEKGRYEGTYSKMAAKEIFSAIYACAVITDVDGNTYYSGVVAYSPERFGYINQSKPDVALANLAKNVVIYGDAARTFFYG